MSFRNISIRRKLIFLIVATTMTSLAMAMACAALRIHDCNTLVVGDAGNSLRGYLPNALIVMLAAVFLASLLAKRAQRFIFEPILHLAHVTESVSKGRDYSIRAQKRCNDEVGQLTDSLNEMLEQVQRRDTDLRKAREELEMRIIQRTAELHRQAMVRNQAEHEPAQQHKRLTGVNDQNADSAYPMMMMLSSASAPSDFACCTELGIVLHLTEPIEQSELNGIVAVSEDVLELLGGVDGDRAFLREMVDMFFTEIDKLMVDVREAVASADRLRLERAAYDLKRVAAYFGAKAAYDAASRLEDIVRDPCCANPEAACQLLQREMDKLKSRLRTVTPSTPHE